MEGGLVHSCCAASSSSSSSSSCSSSTLVSTRMMKFRVRSSSADFGIRMCSMVPAERVGVAKSTPPLGGESFVRLNIRKMPLFKATQPIEVLSRRLGKKVSEIIKLDANENPYGPPPEVAEALGGLQFTNIYPDPESGCLRAALAEHLGLESEYLVVGSGADELIRLIMSCMLDPGDKIIDCPPTFPRYEIEAGICGALVIKVPRRSDFSLNIPQIVEEIKKERPKCIFITSPNNPDGSLIDEDDLLTLLSLPVLVVLDEAYIEFSGAKSRMQWVKRCNNLIVLQTFSKSCGLAGLRVGYGAFPLSIVPYIWRAKLPYNVSVAAQVSALATLKNPAYIKSVKNLIVKERERMFNLLNEVPFLTPFRSNTNFILCEVTSGMEAKRLQEDLEKMGVMVRHFNINELKGYIRISVGKPRDTDVLMDCLRVLATCKRCLPELIN